jgi:ComF family protein
VRDKMRVDVVTALKRSGRFALDFALPPRCAACGTITDEVHSFCAECWTRVQFMGGSGCNICGLPLEATEADVCAGCLAQPPRIDRMRAAVVYDDISRGIALRLKYGRKIALARTMARYMAPLLDRGDPDALLVPVPLHRWRLWSRGFNQAGLVAREITRITGLASDPAVLERHKRTPPLKGMSYSQRRRVVAGAFRVGAPERVAGKTVILVDDVLTTGNTANACASSLRKAGAARVELISWARVVQPRNLAR